MAATAGCGDCRLVAARRRVRGLEQKTAIVRVGVPAVAHPRPLLTGLMDQHRVLRDRPDVVVRVVRAVAPAGRRQRTPVEDLE